MDYQATKKEVKTFEVKPHGKKFLTVLRVDGYAVDYRLSKRRSIATVKGERFQAGKISGFRFYRFR